MPRAWRLLVALALVVLAWGPVAPAVAGAHPICSDCHAPGRPSPPGATVCAECHDTGQAVPAGPHVDCLACHDPHASGTPGLLRTIADEPRTAGALDPASRSCAGCHATQTDWQGPMGRYQRHPVGLPAQPACAPVTGSISLPLVDVRGTPESGDDVIACITCHDVHATAARNLLRWPSDREAEACSTCHRVNGNACPDGSLARNGGRS